MSDLKSTPLGPWRVIGNSNIQGAARASAYLGSLVPTVLAVVFLSTPRLRRQWAFRILVLALIVALGKGILELQSFVVNMELKAVPGNIDHAGRKGIPDASLGDRMLYGAYVVQSFVPWMCDCALLCKLLSFHPAATTTWRKRASIMALPLAMHIPRVPIVIAAYYFVITRVWDYGYMPVISYRLLLVEGTLQVAENCYCSGFLLYKAHQFAQPVAATTNQRARRGLRYFIQSTLFTFLPASVLQVLWLVVAHVIPPGATLSRADFYLRMFNVIFSVNFGLLAVWWATARIHAQEAAQPDAQLLMAGGDWKPDLWQDTSLLAWALGPLEPEVSSPRSAVNSHPAEKQKALPAEEEGGREVEDTELRRRPQSSLDLQ